MSCGLNESFQSLSLDMTSSVKNAGNLTSLLRWPTAPTGYIATPYVVNFIPVVVHVTVSSKYCECICVCLPFRMEMPVVEVRKHGLWLVAKNVSLHCSYISGVKETVCDKFLITCLSHIYQVKQYIHRILVEADINADYGDHVWDAVGEAGENLYTKGDFKESQLADLDVYLLKKVERYISVRHY